MQETPNLDDWIARIRDRDALTFDDAYWGPRPVGDAVVPRLIKELRLATDGHTPGKSVELPGEMGDVSAVPVLIAELEHSENDIRTWAVLALEPLGAPEGVAAAERHRAAHPADFAEPST